MFPTNLKAHTLAVLRNCQLPVTLPSYTETCGENAGKTTHFVRSIPYRDDGRGISASRDMTQAERRAVCQSVLDDLRANSFDGGVVISNNPDFGGDYLRVEQGSRAFNLICHMKS